MFNMCLSAVLPNIYNILLVRKYATCFIYTKFVSYYHFNNNSIPLLFQLYILPHIQYIHLYHHITTLIDIITISTLIIIITITILDSLNLYHYTTILYNTKQNTPLQQSIYIIIVYLYIFTLYTIIL